MSELLDFDEDVLLIQPSLALMLGLNESIILQQVDYWLEKSLHIIEERSWIYNSYEDWQIQFPFMSVSTIKRAILRLEEKGILISANFNRKAGDKTKWYSINYELLNNLKGVTSPSAQNDQSLGSNWPKGQVKMTQPLPEITTENNHISKMQSALKRIQEQKEKKGREKDGKAGDSRKSRYKNTTNHHQDPGKAERGGFGYKPIPPSLGEGELDCAGFY